MVENSIFLVSQTEWPPETYFHHKSWILLQLLLTNALAPGTDAMVMNVDAAVAEALFKNVPFCKTRCVTQALCFGWFLTQPPLRGLKPNAVINRQAHLPEAIRQNSREKQSKLNYTGLFRGAKGAAPADSFLFGFH